MSNNINAQNSSYIGASLAAGSAAYFLNLSKNCLKRIPLGSNESYKNITKITNNPFFVKTSNLEIVSDYERALENSLKATSKRARIIAIFSILSAAALVVFGNSISNNKNN